MTYRLYAPCFALVLFTGCGTELFDDVATPYDHEEDVDDDSTDNDESNDGDAIDEPAGDDEPSGEDALDDSGTPEAQDNEDNPDAVVDEGSDDPLPGKKDALPPKRPLFGNQTISCQSPDAGRCRSMINRVADFYNRNSRGAVHFSYTSGQGDFNFRVDPSLGHSNSSVQSQYLGNVGTHEFGHKLGLSHSNILTVVKGKTDTIYDRGTIMNGAAFGSPFLNAPQYYYKGWIPAQEVALYKPEARTYELKRITDFSGEGLSTVVITANRWNTENPGVGTPLFVSWPVPGHCRGAKSTRCFAVHRFFEQRGTLVIATVDEGEVDLGEVIPTDLRIRMVPNPNPRKITIVIEN